MTGDATGDDAEREVGAEVERRALLRGDRVAHLAIQAGNNSSSNSGTASLVAIGTGSSHLPEARAVGVGFPARRASRTSPAPSPNLSVRQQVAGAITYARLCHPTAEEMLRGHRARCPRGASCREADPDGARLR